MIKITEIEVTETEIKKITGILKSGKLVQGVVTEQFEDDLGNYLGVKHVVAINTGTAALHTALHAVGVQPGDEVITTPFSFVATANTILMCGAIPIFADVNPTTFNIDSKSIEKLITKKTKAILVVDLYGNPADYDEISELCRKHNLKLVADSCQSIGAEYHGKKLGSIADATAFSFYATKNIFSGEGGAITANDDVIANNARLFRNHGQTQQYTYASLGYNYRLTDVLATIVGSQVADIDRITQQRRQNAEYLTRGLRDVAGLVTPQEKTGTIHAFHQYTIRLTEQFPLTRDELQAYLLKNQIETRIYYPTLLTDVEHISSQSRHTETPIARQIVNQVLSLPVHPHLTREDLDTIISTIHVASKQ